MQRCLIRLCVSDSDVHALLHQHPSSSARLTCQKSRDQSAGSFFLFFAIRRSYRRPEPSVNCSDLSRAHVRAPPSVDQMWEKLCSLTKTQSTLRFSKPLASERRFGNTGDLFQSSSFIPNTLNVSAFQSLSRAEERSSPANFFLLGLVFEDVCFPGAETEKSCRAAASPSRGSSRVRCMLGTSGQMHAGNIRSQT